MPRDNKLTDQIDEREGRIDDLEGKASFIEEFDIQKVNSIRSLNELCYSFGLKQILLNRTL